MLLIHENHGVMETDIMLNLREAEKIMEQNEQMQPVNVSPKKNSFGNLANFRRNRNGAIFNAIQPDIKKILEEKKAGEAT